MRRCSNCNNELIEIARFCNICGTPVPGAPALTAASTAHVRLKPTVDADSTRVLAVRESRSTDGWLTLDASLMKPGSLHSPASMPATTRVARAPAQVKTLQLLSAPATADPDKTITRPSSSLYILGLLVVILAGSLLMNSSAIIPRYAPGAPETVPINGAGRWVGDTTITPPRFDFSLSSTDAQKIGISPLFVAYYTTHHGSLNLGAPITVAFPTRQGWMQFFEFDALLLPTAPEQQQLSEKEQPLSALVASGLKDPATGIIRLPLLEALLTAGSQVSPGGEESQFTYIDLRRAASPVHMLPVPASVSASPSRPVGSQPVFIKTGTRLHRDVGHLIPLPFWHYITRSDVSPDGWQADFGLPLTEALAFSFTAQGSVHHLLVQAFTRDAVMLDESMPGPAGQPSLSRLKTSLAYLRTLGPPSVTVQPQQPVWAQGDTALFATPGGVEAVAHVGLHFPLVLLGDTAWNSGMLWYRTRWAVPKSTGNGWVQASLLTFTSPGNVVGWASFDTLSPPLAAYLASIGGNVDAVVYDMTRQRYYTYNASAQFITGSSMKVPIMLTFLDMTEREGREPDADELSLLTTMIENSNNDSASALYYGEIGGAAGVAAYLQRIGISGLSPNPNAWGYSLITPLSMVNLLTLLYEAQILTPSDRNLAFSLMEHIESDQQVGVGDTAPAAAITAMKDGWLPGPDGLWAMNSSGIVMAGNETYIISVYTQEQNSLEDGQAITRHVCRMVASLLT